MGLVHAVSLCHCLAPALTLILRMGLGHSGTGTQRDWYKWIVHNRTGVQWTWYTTGLVHNRPVTQQDLDTAGLGRNGAGEQWD